MTTVASRTFRSSPYRGAAETWGAIVDLLTSGKSSSARTELLSVRGVASSIIADQASKDSPIVVSCDGPRTRIYGLYDEDAIDGSGASEDLLGFDPLKGDWGVSLPCAKDDLASVVHVDGVSKPKAQFEIVAGIIAPKSSWADGLGETFRKNMPTDPLERLDCGCALEHGAFDSFDGKLKVTEHDAALIYFLFRLLSKLQSLGSVPAIDWTAYTAAIK